MSAAPAARQVKPAAAMLAIIAASEQTYYHEISHMRATPYEHDDTQWSFSTFTRLHSHWRRRRHTAGFHAILLRALRAWASRAVTFFACRRHDCQTTSCHAVTLAAFSRIDDYIEILVGDA